MSLKRKAVRSSAANTFRSLLEAGLTFAAFLVYVRFLRPEDFGIFALASAVVALLKVGLDCGMSRALIQREQIEDQHRYTAFWTHLVIGITVTALLWWLSPWVGRAFDFPRLPPVLRVLSLVLAVKAFGFTPRAILVRRLDFAYIATCSVLGNVIGVSAGIFLVLQGYGLWGMVAHRVVMPLVGTASFLLRAESPFGVSVSVRALWDLSSFGSFVVGKKVLRILGQRVDDLLIGFFLGATALGFYSVAYRFVQMIQQLFISSITEVALPLLSQFRQTPSRLKRVFLTVLRLTSLVAFPVLAMTATLAPAVVPVVFGTGWDALIPLLWILAPFGAVGTVVLLHTPVLTALGRPGLDMIVGGVQTSLILMLLPSVLRFRGSLELVLLTLFVIQLLTLVFARATLDSVLTISWVDYGRELLPALVFATMAGFTSMSVVFSLELVLPPYLLLAVGFLAGSISGGAVVAFFGPRHFAEMAELVGLLGPKAADDGLETDPDDS